jgi:methylated-DNA-[protein]-cysteine S-methyltransferase
MEYISLFETEHGTGAVVASEQGIRRVFLPQEIASGVFEYADQDRMTSSVLTDRASRMLIKYFKGEPQPFEVLPVEIHLSGGFRVQVLGLIRSIPFGTVKSYGEVAILAGSPGAARAVGGALAANPIPIIIPCHRVVAGNGRLTGFSAPGGVKLKKNLLQMEGVEFKGELICQVK